MAPSCRSSSPWQPTRSAICRPTLRRPASVGLCFVGSRGRPGRSCRSEALAAARSRGVGGPEYRDVVAGLGVLQGAAG
eukprot:620183-Alexandrium_andersonii.AAC.1